MRTTLMLPHLLKKLIKTIITALKQQPFEHLKISEYIFNILYVENMFKSVA